MCKKKCLKKGRDVSEINYLCHNLTSQFLVEISTWKYSRVFLNNRNGTLKIETSKNMLFLEFSSSLDTWSSPVKRYEWIPENH